MPAIVANSLALRSPSACKAHLVDNKYIDITLGEFTLNFPLNGAINQRHVDWPNCPAGMMYLKSELAKAKKTNTTVCFGSHYTASIEFLKNKFGATVTTAGTYYNSNLYSLLLDTTADYHLFMLEHQYIIPTQVDLELRKTSSRSELLGYYKDAFHKQKLIATSTAPVCDYNLNLEDMFINKACVVEFCNNIGVPITTEATDLYNTWFANYSMQSDE
jgi:hypothetical protein